MTEEQMHQIPEEELEKEAKRKRKNAIVIILIVVGDLFLAACCCLPYLAVIFSALPSIRQAEFRIPEYSILAMNDAEIVDEFFLALSEKDVLHAVLFLSEQGKINYPVEELEAMVNGDDFVLFEIFVNSTVTDLNIHTNLYGHKEIGGILNYQGAYSGEFSVVLEVEDGDYLISQFEITVPNNVESYFRNNSNSENSYDEIVKNFFHALSEKDVDSAFLLLSEQGKRNYPVEDLEAMVNGDALVLFHIFDNSLITNVSVRTTGHDASHLEMWGTLQIEGNAVGEFYVYFQEEDGEYLITHFQVNILPEEIENYLENN